MTCWPARGVDVLMPPTQSSFWSVCLWGVLIWLENFVLPRRSRRPILKTRTSPPPLLKPLAGVSAARPETPSCRVGPVLSVEKKPRPSASKVDVMLRAMGITALLQHCCRGWGESECAHSMSISVHTADNEAKWHTRGYVRYIKRLVISLPIEDRDKAMVWIYTKGSLE